MKKLLLLAAIAAAVILWQRQPDLAPASEAPPAPARAAPGTDALADAFRHRQSGVPVSGDGVVVRVLADDEDGSRHQRFVLALASGQTVLIANNIDLAPRIGSLREGDRVEFRGVYEWNDRGGVVHWTHQDPQGLQEPGWLRHNGRTYQ